MPLFVWDSSFDTGIEEVDNQHRRLVEMLNQLEESVATGASHAALEELVSGLFEYTRYHFSTEERLMADCGAFDPAERERHQAIHRDFVAELEKAAGHLFDDDDETTRTLLDYLVKWLAHHILGADQRMARQLIGDEIASETDSDEADTAVAEQHLLNALQESQQRFRVLADSLPVLVWVTDNKHRRVYQNHAWEDFTGLPVHEGERWGEALHPKDVARYRAAIARPLTDHSGWEAEFRLRHVDGSYRWVMETAVPRLADGEFTGHVGSCLDITERKRSESQLEALVEARTAQLAAANAQLKKRHDEQQVLIGKLEQAHNQLLQSEKMAALGQLAAGVAHEINNPVGFVRSNINSLKRQVDQLLALLPMYQQAAVQCSDGQLRKQIAEAEAQADLDFLAEDIGDVIDESVEGLDRVGVIVRDLKGFAHVDAAELTETDLHQGLDSTLNVVANEIKYRAQVIREYGELPRIWCRPQQINQVFMNLLVNAAQAMDNRKGSIRIRTRALADQVQIDIEDNGHGIAEDQLARIFEPFYTTKAVGKGTGLGLSISYGIIRRHHGEISVESKLGVGTRFRITLPVKPPEESADSAASPGSKSEQ